MSDKPGDQPHQAAAASSGSRPAGTYQVLAAELEPGDVIGAGLIVEQVTPAPRARRRTWWTRWGRTRWVERVVISAYRIPLEPSASGEVESFTLNATQPVSISPTPAAATTGRLVAARNLSAGDLIKGNLVVVRVEPTDAAGPADGGVDHDPGNDHLTGNLLVDHVRIVGIRATSDLRDNWADELVLPADLEVYATTPGTSRDDTSPGGELDG